MNLKRIHRVTVVQFFVIASIPLDVLCAQDANTPNVDSENTLKVMTWNLEWFFDENASDNYSALAKEKSTPSREQWDWRRDAVSDSLAKYRPDIAAFQEIENRRVLWYLTRSLQRNHQLRYLETALEGRDVSTEQDVGMITSESVEIISEMMHGYTPSLRATKSFQSVTKHLQAEVAFEFNGISHPVIIFNTHLRARPEAAELRIKQARLIHRWIKKTLESGANVLVLGDINTEHTGDEITARTDIGVLCGMETAERTDDLIDLTRNLAPSDRQTHLLPGKEFDRILCSRSLIEDTPNVPDLVFKSIETIAQASIRGSKDTPEQHWDHYWQITDDQRDLSDHLPVMASFEVR